MTRAEFFDITKRIEAINPGKEFSKRQFEEWWDSFKDEEYEIALRAFKLMKDEYAYFPMVATFRSYIEKVKQMRKAEDERKERTQSDEIKSEDRDRHQQWMRYIYWILETKQFPKSPEEAFEAKERFEKEHPDWQPRFKEQKQGMQSVGEILERRS